MIFKNKIIDFKALPKLLPISLLFIFLFASCTDSQFTKSGCTKEDCNAKGTSNFYWDNSSWSICSKACGGGTQTRTVNCLNEIGTVVSDPQCYGNKPTTTQICQAQACTSDYTWLTGSWENCSKACGGGTQTRTVVCKDNDGNTVTDTQCTSQKLEVSQSCNSNSCEGTFSWNWSDWTICSQPCGNGTRSRQVFCADENKNPVDEELCTGNRPSSQELCNTHACALTYSWFTGDWGTCSMACGQGTQIRAVSCLRSDGEFVADSFCSGQAPASTQPCSQTCNACNNPKTINASVDGSSHLLDILIVVDDSGSMAQDNLKLAQRLKGFTETLENMVQVDWQICITTTDADYFQGRPIVWQGHNSVPNYILKSSTSDLHSIFINTIKWIGYGWNNDEQGIKAMNLSVMNNHTYQCFRQNAALSVILISDEDERSVGGDSSLSRLQYKPLGTLNQPGSFQNTINNEFSQDKKFNVNSIIVKDANCKHLQDVQGAGAKSFYGKKYQALSQLTKGETGSICSYDYTPHLNLFANIINKTMSSLTLQCHPTQTPEVTVIPKNSNQTITINEDQVTFTPVIRGPAEINGSYCCP